MSQVEDLKQQLQALAADAKQVSAGMAAYKAKLGEQSGTIMALIEGTATGKDKSITTALGAAAGAVDQTVTTLSEAVQACTDFADGL